MTHFNTSVTVKRHRENMEKKLTSLYDVRYAQIFKKFYEIV